MTEEQALKRSIEVWKYLAKHPDITNKNSLPLRLYNKVKNCPARCPLCEYYKFQCRKCPLPAPRDGECKLFFAWSAIGNEKQERQNAALKIVARCEKRLAKLQGED